MHPRRPTFFTGAGFAGCIYVAVREDTEQVRLFRVGEPGCRAQYLAEARQRVRPALGRAHLMNLLFRTTPKRCRKNCFKGSQQQHAASHAASHSSMHAALHAASHATVGVCVCLTKLVCLDMFAARHSPPQKNTKKQRSKSKIHTPRPSPSCCRTFAAPHFPWPLALPNSSPWCRS